MVPIPLAFPRTSSASCIYILALFLPSVIKPGCWPVMRLMKKYQIPIKSNMGKIQEKRSRKKVDSI